MLDPSTKICKTSGKWSQRPPSASAAPAGSMAIIEPGVRMPADTFTCLWVENCFWFHQTAYLVIF